MIHCPKKIRRPSPFPRGMNPILETLKGIGPRREPIIHMPTLIKMLREGSMTDRHDACLGISELAKRDPRKARESLPALIEAFNRWGPMTKAVIAETFVELQDCRALPPLMSQVKSPYPELRRRIEWALSNIPVILLKRI